jgi:hypothetical protein
MSYSDANRASVRFRVSIALVVFPLLCQFETRGDDAEFVLQSLPRVQTRFVEQFDFEIARLMEIGDIERRAKHLRQLFSKKDVVEQRTEKLRTAVESTLRRLDPDQLPSFASVIAHYPSLHESLTSRASNSVDRDQVCLGLVRNVPGFSTAKRWTEAIHSVTHKRFALEVLIRKAPTFDEKLFFLQELTSLEGLDDWASSNYFSLRPFASQRVDAICRSVRDHVPADQRVGILKNFAVIASENSILAARQYQREAWKEVLSHSKPWVPASQLLRSRVLPTVRSEWLSRFDQFVLPALVDAECGIDPLAELIRFDLSILIDRTERSCVHPARQFETVFPRVMERAFSIAPQIVLRWIENDRRQFPRQVSDKDAALNMTADRNLESGRSLRDRCIFKICQFLSVYLNLAEPAHRSSLHRLCDAALTIQHEELRLDAVAAISAELPRLNCQVPEEVLREGRQLLGADYRLRLRDLDDADHFNQFCLLDNNHQQSTLEQFVGQLEDEEQQTFVYRAGSIMNLVRVVCKSDGSCLKWLQRMEQVAGKRQARRTQAQIASEAVRVDVDWAIRAIWATLPTDRGASGKTSGNIGWSPTPSDAGDAIDWLERGLPDDTKTHDSKLRLIAALHRHLMVMPKPDRDLTRAAIGQRLARLRYFDHAFGVIETIENSRRRADAKADWIAQH